MTTKPSPEPRTLWLVGYGAWPAPKRSAKLVETLRARGVTRLVDARHGPCSSDVEPGRLYGPKPWNLQAGAAGIVGILGDAGIGYDWIVELGNPQRTDPLMTILRAHLADEAGGWPVHRGLERLARIVERPGEVVALLCACADGSLCHRTVVADVLNERHFGGDLSIREAK